MVEGLQGRPSLAATANRTGSLDGGATGGIAGSLALLSSISVYIMLRRRRPRDALVSALRDDPDLPRKSELGGAEITEAEGCSPPKELPGRVGAA